MDTNPIKYKDLILPDDSIETLIKQLDEANEAYNNIGNSIKAEAQRIAAAMKTVSGATNEGREATRGYSESAQKLLKAERDLNFARSETARQIAELKAAQKDEQTITKLTVQLNRTQEGTYEHLAAQYGLNKIRLNAMTAEYRRNNAEGRKLEQETAAIYEEMKTLQEATGKHQLNVGNYADATKGLRSQIMELTEELVRLRMEGKQDTEEYQKVSEKAAELKDAFADAQSEVRNLSSDTSDLNTVLDGLGAAGGGFAVATGAMSLFGSESTDIQQAQTRLQAAIAITNGLTALQAKLQHESNLMLGIAKIQTIAKTKAEALSTKTTIAATIAQKAFNAVAAMNPYVLLAIAIMSVVGALIAFSDGTKEAAKQQKALNEIMQADIEYLEHTAKRSKEVSDQKVEGIQNELEVAKARNASTQEIREIEDKLLQERKRANSWQKGYYADEIKNIEENKKKIDELINTLHTLRIAKANQQEEVTIKVGMEMKEFKVEDAIEHIQSQIDNYGKKVEIAVGIVTESNKLETEQKALAEKRKEEDKAVQRSVTETLRQEEDARISIIADASDRQRAQSRAATKRAIEDIRFRLSNEVNLTVEQRTSLNNQITYLQKQLSIKLTEINQEQKRANLQVIRATEDATFELMEDGAEKRRILLAMQYKRELEDIDNRMSSERDKTSVQYKELEKQRSIAGDKYKKDLKKLNDEIAIEELNAQKESIELLLSSTEKRTQEDALLRLEAIQKQREIELAENRLLAEELRQDEKAINAKYDKMAAEQARKSQYEIEMSRLNEQQALQNSEIELMKTSEAKKTALRLQFEKERLQKILELAQENGRKLTQVEIQTIKNEIAAIDKEINKAQKPQDVYDLLGLNLDDEQKEAISQSFDFAIEQLNSYLDSWVKAAEKKVELANQEVDSAKTALDAEREARANGYASNVEYAQKELDLAKQNQQKALREQERAQKAQQALATVQQATNLITASALIWSQLGFPWAIPAIAVMWGSFAAAKIKAQQVTQSGSEEYGEGTVELLQGGSHQSGNDVDLGRKKDGTRRRAEGGEFFAVINKRNSRKYRTIIPDVIRALNAGTFEDKYSMAYQGGQDVSITESPSVDLGSLRSDVTAIREQGERKTYTDSRGTHIVYRNLHRVILN